MGIYLVPTAYTLQLAGTLPDWGQQWETSQPPALPSITPFQQTRCCDASSSGFVKHIVVHALARSSARVANVSDATVCVVAAPPEGACEDWQSLCPRAVPLVVADVADMDILWTTKLCKTLWRQTGSCKNPTMTGGAMVHRLVGSPPVFMRRRMRRCPTLTVPWPSHARSPDAALHPRARRVRIAFAAGVTGHVMATRLGFEPWRRHLRDACHALEDRALCTAIYQPLAGGAARSAIALYARSVFCLQPPGDTVVRSGLVDALSVGCVPVLFHAAQAALWPHHWRAAEASVLFDWPRGAPVSRANATAVLQTLLTMPQERVRALQAGVAAAARRTYYRGELGPREQRDANDVLVDEVLLKL